MKPLWKVTGLLNSTYHGTHVFQIALLTSEKMSKTVTPTCTCHLCCTTERCFFFFLLFLLSLPPTPLVVSSLSSFIFCPPSFSVSPLSMSVSASRCVGLVCDVVLSRCDRGRGCGRVCGVCVGCVSVVCVSVCVGRGTVSTSKTPSVSRFFSSPYVPPPRAHVFQHVPVVPVHTKDVSNLHTGVFTVLRPQPQPQPQPQRHTPQTPHALPHTTSHTTQHATSHGDRDRERRDDERGET